MTRIFKCLRTLTSIAMIAGFADISVAQVSERQQPQPARTANAADKTCPDPDDATNTRYDPTTLRIGVRRHARPFSYFSENLREVWSASPQAPLALQNYTGYMSKICDAVIADMLLTPKPMDPGFSRDDVCVVDIDDLTVRDKENNAPRASRLEYLGDKIDILCDPATITNERRHGFILSPPLFLSGIGLINRRSNQLTPNLACPGSPLFGYVGSTNAALTGIPQVLAANEFKSYGDLLRAFIKGETDQCSTALGEGKIVEEYPNHEEAAEAFCSGKFYYYIGDREIITYNARNVPGCGAEIEGAGQTYSNDRYAIYGKMTYKKGTEIRDMHIARFFEILSQKVVVSPSLLDTAYEDTFIEQPSRKLESFYWNVRGPRKP